MLFRILGRLSNSLLALLFSYVLFLLFTGIDMRDGNEFISNPLIWLIFLVYLVAASFLIDWIMKKVGEKSNWTYVSAYTVAGMFIWALMFIPVAFSSITWFFYIVIYYSIFTVLGFVLFFIFQKTVRMSYRKMLMIGLPSLVILLMVVVNNPSLKSGFVEEYGDNYYEASFDSFNGEEDFVIPVEAGKNYIIDFEWSLQSDGRHGISVASSVHEMGTLTSDEETENWTYYYEASESGELDFSFNGYRIEGSFTATWEEI